MAIQDIVVMASGMKPVISPTNRQKLATRNFDDIFKSSFKYRIDANIE